MKPIEFVDGKPVVTWEPDLNEGGAKKERVYVVEGAETLGGDECGAPVFQGAGGDAIGRGGLELIAESCGRFRTQQVASLPYWAFWRGIWEQLSFWWRLIFYVLWFLEGWKLLSEEGSKRSFWPRTGGRIDFGGLGD